MAVEITDANIDETLESGLTVIDFWAQWCGPCRMVGPIIDALSEENKEDGVVVGKLNVDENPNSAVKYGIRSIPCVIFFKDGEPVDRLLGAQPKGAYQAKIDEHK